MCTTSLSADIQASPNLITTQHTSKITSNTTQSNRQPSRRLQKQRLVSLLLDSVTTIFVLHYLYHHPSYLNPWNIPNAKIWITGFICIRCAIAFYDHLVVFLIESCFKCKVLPTREPGAPPVRYVELDVRSIIYLSINSLNEYAFVMRLTHYIYHGGQTESLPYEISNISPGNTILALGIMFTSMDMLYAPLHHLLHLPSFYPLVHKHHHRQHFPTRGYLDAGNEHPIEHMIGVICIWFSLMTAEVLLPSLLGFGNKLLEGNAVSAVLGSPLEWVQGGGVHAVTVLIFFQLHAALAMMNHSPYNVQFSLPFIGSSTIFGKDSKLFKAMEKIPLIGTRLQRLITGQWFHYSVGHHEMHHRKFNYNYGQYCMWYDLFMGTFLEYEGPLGAKELEAKKMKNKVKEK